LDAGVLEQYFTVNDIICLTETKCNYVDPLKLKHHSAIFAEPKGSSSLGGVHGMVMLISKKYEGQYEVISNSKSESVLWVKFSQNVTGFTFIIGAVYVPPENSKYYSSDIFDDICDDCMQIVSKFNNVPMLLIGDFNARTGNLDDFIALDDVIAAETNCDFMNDSCPNSKFDLEQNGICTTRHNLDCNINSSGRHFINLCKTADLHIVNGRLGADRGIGQLTCDAASTVDYAVCSPSLFYKISDFFVHIFDSLLSDKHNALSLIIKKAPIMSAEEHEQQIQHETHPLSIKPVWDSAKKELFSASFCQNTVTSIANSLNICNAEDSNFDLQTRINEIADQLKSLYLNTAESCNLIIKTGKKSEKKKLSCKPWFNTECKELRKDYNRTKNAVKKRVILPDLLKSKALAYKKSIRKAKRDYNLKIHEQLRKLKSSKPKDFWSLVSCKNKTTNPLKIGIEALYEHFKTLSQSDTNSDSELDLSQDLQEPPPELESPIQISEIINHIAKLKNNKASGIDAILNEFIKNSPKEVLELITRLFNLVLDTSYVPTDWTIGLIRPLYKGKGSPNDSDNYRGITLLSCLGKLFTAVLNNRISKYLESNNLLGEEQAGFRSGYSTSDHIFTLYSIIKLYQQSKHRMYCAFIDYKKAFDLIDRASLWSKLLSHGIHGKITNAIKQLYQNAKSCVLLDRNRSEFFDCNIGVRQGENLSPILFAIYLNDFDKHLSTDYAGLRELSRKYDNIPHFDSLQPFLKLFSLLYADDTIIMADSASELQSALNSLNSYSEMWKLRINPTKSKIIIFSRGKIRNYPTFMLGNSQIEVVDDYTYLGCTFNYNNKFKKAKCKQVQQARRALYSLQSRAYDLSLPADIYSKLFDSIVTPILLYGSEIWGVEDISAVENFHTKFCKKLLRVHKYTPNVMAYAELGRSPLKYEIENRMLNYWLRVGSDKKTKLNHILYKMQRAYSSLYPEHFPWIKKIKCILDNLGLSYLWDADPTTINKEWFKRKIKLIQSDIINQNILSEINENSQCITYRIFKASNKIEHCLVQPNSYGFNYLVKFRCINHRLPIVQGRFSNIPRSNRYCTYCLSNNNMVIGNEYHYLLECPLFEEERKLYIDKKISQSPNLNKFKCLFQTNSIRILTNLNKFCKILINHFKQ